MPTNGGDSNTDHSGTVVSTTLSSLGQFHLVGLTSACCRMFSVFVLIRLNCAMNDFYIINLRRTCAARVTVVVGYSAGNAVKLKSHFL